MRQLVNKLKDIYRLRKRIPVVPWLGTQTTSETVQIEDVYIDPEIVHFENPAASSNRIVLKGRTGSGKSTLLLKMATDWADGKRIDIQGFESCEALFLIPLTNLDHDSNLGEEVGKHLMGCNQFSPRTIERFMEENQEKVAILLDGYDEFKGKGQEQEHSGTIVKMLRREFLPYVRLLVATRPGRINDFVGVTNVFPAYILWEITGFSSSSIDSYIDNAFKQQPLIGNKLRDFLEESHLKTDLACLPLMCCAFCQLAKWTDGRDFPNINTMSSLLGKLIKNLLQYHRENENEAFLLDLGKVALNGFFKSEKEELIFTEADFKTCTSNATIVNWGCVNGLLFRDDVYRPMGLEDDANGDNSIRFILKIFQEKFAGMYLSHLLKHRNNYFTLQWIRQIFEKRRIYLKFKTLSGQRILDLRNVFLFACGESIDAARVIIGLLVKDLMSRGDDLQQYWKGELDFRKHFELIVIIELCLQFNYECQSRGALNDILKPLFNTCNRIRLVESTSLVARHISYLMEYSHGLPIKALEIIRISLETEFSLRSINETFYGLETYISNSFGENLEQCFSNEERLKEEEMRNTLCELMVKGIKVPKNLLMMVPAQLFNNVMDIWRSQKVKERRKIRHEIITNILPGLGTCDLSELVLSGLREERTDSWDNLFTNMAHHKSRLQKVALVNDGLEEVHMPTLLTALTSQRNLIYLDLSGNKIGNKFVELVADRPLPNLQTLALKQTDMSSATIGQLGNLLSSFSSLQTLDIHWNAEMDDNALHTILQNLRHCPRLERLMLALDKITEIGFRDLENTILPPLKMLQLHDSALPRSAIKCVCTILPNIGEIEELWISGPLHGESTYDTLDVIEQDEVRQFADVISGMSTLRVVKALYIKFDVQGFDYLLEKCVESRLTGLHEFW